MREEITVNGRLRDRNGIWHAEIYWVEKNGGQRKQRMRSFSTKILVKGKKELRLAEEILISKKIEIRKELEENPRYMNLKQKMKSQLYIEQYLNLALEKKFMIQDYSPATKVTQRRSINSIIEFFEGKNITLSNLNKYHLEEMIEYFTREKKLKSSSIKSYLTIFHNLYITAVEDELVEKDIFQTLKKIRLKQTVKKVITKAELPLFFSMVDSSDYKLEIYLMIRYGLRKGEVMGLRFSDIDLERNTITINQSLIWDNIKKEYYVNESLKTKNSHRRLPLVTEIKELLKDRASRIEEDKKFFKSMYQKEYEDYICVDRKGNMLSSSALADELKKIAKKHNFRHIHPHLLRHSFGSIAWNEGLDIKLIQLMLGHAKLQTTADIYTHYDLTKEVMLDSKLDEMFK